MVHDSDEKRIKIENKTEIDPIKDISINGTFNEDSILSSTLIDQSFEGKENHKSKNFCTPCGKPFSDKKALKRHDNKHHKKMLYCDVCLQDFDTKANLKRHLKSKIHLEKVKAEKADFEKIAEDSNRSVVKTEDKVEEQGSESKDNIKSEIKTETKPEISDENSILSEQLEVEQ